MNANPSLGAIDLLAELTLQEKAALCMGAGMWHTAAVPRLGIASIMVADAPHGLRRKPDDGDQAGISGSLPATCFPTASALGSSWDLDLEMPPNFGVSDVEIVAAASDGTLDEGVLDQAVLRVLELVGKAEDSRACLSGLDSLNMGAHHTLARAAAAECAVLLKNEGSILPLRPEVGELIAVIGEFARTKVGLEPGEAARISFGLQARDLSYWSPIHQRWVLEGGVFQIAVGASSRDLRLITTVDVAAPSLPTRLDDMATLREWLADAAGSAAIREAIGVDEDGQPRGILADDELMKVIGDFPLSSLAVFPGAGIDYAVIADLIRRIQPRQSR